MLYVKGTCFFALTTPEGGGNWFSRLFKLTESDGKTSFFRICQCQMICEECRKLEPLEQLNCTHVKDMPHWLSSKDGARLKLLYKADPVRAIKEFGGIIEDSFTPCFPKSLIAQMFSNPPLRTTTPPRAIIITVDPGAGPSQMGICSGYMDNDLNFVVKKVYYLDSKGPIQYSFFALLV
jgi:hypothetical protein